MQIPLWEIDGLYKVEFRKERVMDTFITACVVFAILFAGLFIRSFDMQSTITSTTKSTDDSMDEIGFQMLLMDDDNRRLNPIYSYEVDNIYHEWPHESLGGGFHDD